MARFDMSNCNQRMKFLSLVSKVRGCKGSACAKLLEVHEKADHFHSMTCKSGHIAMLSLVYLFYAVFVARIFRFFT